MSYSKQHLNESVEITKAMNPETIEKIVKSTGVDCLCWASVVAQLSQGIWLTTLEN